MSRVPEREQEKRGLVKLTRRQAECALSSLEGTEAVVCTLRPEDQGRYSIVPETCGVLREFLVREVHSDGS